MNDRIRDLLTFRQHYTQPATPFSMPEGAAEKDAYAVQDAVIREMAKPIVGWKIGAGNVEAQRALGLQQPFVGAVFEGRAHKSGIQLSVPEAVSLQLECEIGVTLRESYSPQQQLPSADTLLDQIDRWLLVLEVISLSSPPDGPPRGVNVVAENGGCDGLVLGDEIPNAPQSLLSSLSLEVKNGSEPSQIFTVNRTPHEVAHALRETMKNVLSRGHKIPAGTVFATGHLCGIFTLAPNGRFTATLGELATVSVSR